MLDPSRGDSLSGFGNPASPVATTQASGAAAVFPTRRELRAAQEANKAGSRNSVSAARRQLKAARKDAAARPVPQAPASVVLSTHAIAERAAAQATAAQQSGRRAAVTPAVVSRPVQPARSGKKRASAAVTIVAVCGLFATTALPAYAIGFGDETGATTASTADTQLAAQTALTVPTASELTATKRETYSATTPADLRRQALNAQMTANYDAYVASGAADIGDDYPYYAELSNNQGGGLSPLNYFYRECVDFVAWRLNRDAGSTSAPYKYVWADLTPGGGSAYAWKSAWERHGWTVSATPKVGSVAWFGFHVAYVSKVNDDGTVFIEEYNYASDHLYGTRTIQASEATYLYAPPR